ncbi:MAG: PaaI family thioesterase [Dehalococcoidia bacterium]|nr:PaaI family thioesterase [Dehalococcoidia bacterium]
MSTGAQEMRSAPGAREFDEFPLHRTLGLKLEEARTGFARIRLDTSPLTLGGVGGSVHGGVLAAMVDIVMLRALFATIEPGDQPAGTADLDITYLRPALGKRIYAEATVLRKGRQLAVTEVSILDDSGKLCAKGRTIYAFRAGS